MTPSPDPWEVLADDTFTSDNPTLARIGELLARYVPMSEEADRPFTALREQMEREQRRASELLKQWGESIDENRALRTQAERQEAVVTAARELLWAFEHTYDDPGPGSRIPTLQRAVAALSPTGEPTKDERCPTCGKKLLKLNARCTSWARHANAIRDAERHTKDKTPEIEP